VLTCLLAMTSWAPIAYPDSTAELDDAQARAQYAFYTADVRGLEAVVTLIERLSVPDSLSPMKAYNAAYGRWKLAQLRQEAAERDDNRAARSLSAKAAQDCLAHTKTALSLDPRMVEAYVLDTACAMLTHEPRAGKALSTTPACARSKSLHTAQQLEPNNPRVMLIEAVCLHGDDAASATSGFDRLRAVAAAFEAAPPSRPGAPDWGQAEALVLLGQNYLQRGDTHAARDVIEKALVIAPDYRRARELLDTAAARSH
jgi:tetratricopeptide (TPR) repeat protein